MTFRRTRRFHPPSFILSLNESHPDKPSPELTLLFFSLFTDGPAYVNVNIFVRSISRIDDVAMVS